MHELKDFKIWNKAIDLSEEVYKITTLFPKEEMYNLTSRIRRSAVSVASNMAEGAGRNTNGEFVHFLGIARGSAYELQTQIVIAKRLGFIGEEAFCSLDGNINELLQMIYSFKENIKNRIK
jgi:four helix bundle protein